MVIFRIGQLSGIWLFVICKMRQNVLKMGFIIHYHKSEEIKKLKCIPYWPLFNRHFLTGLFFNRPYGQNQNNFNRPYGQKFPSGYQIYIRNYKIWRLKF